MPRFDFEQEQADFDDDHDYVESELDEQTSGLRNPPVSGKGIASLVFSVMFCVPLLPSLLAVILGAMCLRETNRGTRSGRGLGLLGTMLGVLGVGAWMMVGAISFLVWDMYTTQTTASKEVARAFLNELSEGKVDEALARTKEGTPKGPLNAVAKAMKGWGKFRELGKRVEMQPVDSKKKSFHWEMVGKADFSKTNRDFTMRLAFDGSTYRVERFEIDGKWAVGGGRWGDP